MLSLASFRCPFRLIRRYPCVISCPSGGVSKYDNVSEENFQIKKKKKYFSSLPFFFLLFLFLSSSYSPTFPLLSNTLALFPISLFPALFSYHSLPLSTPYLLFYFSFYISTSLYFHFPLHLYSLLFPNYSLFLSISSPTVLSPSQLHHICFSFIIFTPSVTSFSLFLHCSSQLPTHFFHLSLSPFGFYISACLLHLKYFLSIL